MKQIVIGIGLFLIAIILIVVVTPINYILVWNKDYFRDTALSLNKWANREYRTLWNKILIKQGYQFGKPNEAMSSVLGKNILTETLTNTGKVLVWILTKEHCINAII